jgi:hypothetical protein
MQEFTTVSSSSYDPAALAAKLTEKSADGWSVVSIVSTGGDVTAFLSRESTGAAPAAEAPAAAAPISQPVPVIEPAAAEPAPSYEPSLPSYEPAPAAAAEPAPAAAEPAGWAVAPDPAPVAPIVESAPAATYTPAPATAYTPAPAAATPAVPAGWYADPAGRFELRYWDGGTWTEHVSRAGQQYTDPPVA